MTGGLLDLIWPRRCAVCERPVDRPGRYLCTDCLNRLPIVPSNGLCRRCGREAPGLDGEFLCDWCRDRKTKPHFDRAAAAMLFETEARELINAFKFQNAYHLRDDFVDLLEGAVRARFVLGEVELVVPVPSTLGHRLLRGYNQCDYLAKALARRLGLPYEPRFLRRVGSPRRQGTLTAEARRENVVGTFALTRRGEALAKKTGTVLVIDDIMTTGSTLSECARTLKAAGLRRVFCATLAHTPWLGA